MRPILASLALLAAFAIPAAAHADGIVFTFTPANGGGTLVIDLPATPTAAYPEGQDPPYNLAQYAISMPDVTEVNVFGSSEGVYFDAHYGYGPTPFDISIYTNGAGEYLLDGPQLFSGTVSDPTYLDGTYILTGDQSEGNNIGGTLVITGGSPAVAATPEPSSLILLGTGLVGAAGMARRRFKKQS